MPMVRIPHNEDARALAMKALEAAGIPRNLVLVRQETGIANHVYRVGRDYILRLGTGSDGAYFEKSCQIIDKLQGIIKCQRLVYADTTCRELSVPVMICEYVPGRTLLSQWPTLDRAQKNARIEQILMELVKLHGYDYRGIECLRNDGDWPGRMRNQMQAVTSRAAADAGVDQSLVQALDEFWQAHESLLDTAEPPVLIHNDAHPGNAIFSEAGELRTLIDFEDAEVSPVEVEYWNIARELEETAGLDIRAIKAMLAGYHDFGDGDALVRYRLDAVFWMMWSLASDLSWKSRRTCIASAWHDYRNVVIGEEHTEWFAN